jgi:hypothetical protein
MAPTLLPGVLNLKGNEKNNNSTFEFLQKGSNIACSTPIF